MAKRSLLAGLDQVFFLKNGYPILKHVLPVAVEALILLLLTIPADNLLLLLANRLAVPGAVWVPAGLLTLITLAAYILMLATQIRKAYLFPRGDVVRTVFTALVFILLCMIISAGVLQQAAGRPLHWGDAWTCFLLAALSLTGIGWAGPAEWADQIGVRIPDYQKGREASRNIRELLKRLRDPAAQSTADDLADLLDGLESLRVSIQDNLLAEPEWAKTDLNQATSLLRELTGLAEQHFGESDEQAAYLAIAVQGQMSTLFGDFQTALANCTRLFPAWKGKLPD